MIFFENTEIAFANKSTSSLRRALWLFRILQIGPLYVFWSKLMGFCVKYRLPVSWIVKRTYFKQFCGGTSLDESVLTVVKLAKYNVKSILDYSVEGNKSIDEIRKTMDESVRGIELPACCANIAFAVLKPSAICGEDILSRLNSNNGIDISRNTNVFRERVEELCWKAYEKKISIMIDAEDVVFQDFIDETVTEMMEKFNRDKIIVYNTIQMYRTDRLEYLNKCLERAVSKGYKLGFKLVRGAFMEKERARALQMNYSSPIWPDKDSTDRAYNQALGFCVYNIDKISILAGTHNEESCFFLTELMKKNGVAKNDSRIYFAQLYGMGDHISFNLACEGYNVAKYIPYGPINKVIPYLIRSANENSSIAAQASRERSLIATELKRRKKIKL